MISKEAVLMNKELKIGLCLSGGGSRAIAFHLGCLRALNDLNLLDKVQVVSTVSGGSVIGSLYVFGNKPFEEFENDVLELLRDGLARSILWRYILSFYFLLELANIALVLVGPLFGLNVRRYFNRSNMFQRVLDKKLFNGIHLNSATRNGINIIINATELRTCTAFRFGNDEVSCWKFGKIDPKKIKIAEAVASSAAYPVFLPPFDRIYKFIKNKKEKKERVVITDGGVYENLGITPLFPDRVGDFGKMVEQCDVIIACDAGNRFEDKEIHSQWIVPHLKKCFSSVMRRVQIINFKLLHQFMEERKIKGFVLAYLNQDDKRLPYQTPEFVSKAEVENYPTDFYAMTEEDIGKLSSRGEEITKILVSHYLSKNELWN